MSGPSPTAYQGKAKWMEEGTANVFSRTPTFQSKNKIAANLLPQVYAARLSHEPSFDTAAGIRHEPIWQRRSDSGLCWRKRCSPG